jgi:phosphatidate cytidylyltransferase
MAMMLIPALERRLAPDHAMVPEAPQDGTHRAPPARAYVFPGVAILLGWAVLLVSVRGSAESALGGIAIAAIAALLIGAFSSRAIDLAMARAFGILIALCYGALPWLVVWQLYRMSPNARYVLLVMTVTWAGDTGGYFGGRFLGGKIFGDRKLAPTMSPKKTWEGALSGLLLSVIGAWLYSMAFLNDLGDFYFMCRLAAVAGAAAQAGDLVESTFKRFAGVKDSGFIIPGHGGFLDRVDGILFAAPVIWAFLYYCR